MSVPAVTVVVNCYNRAEMVCTALDSVWNQSYRPLELIIVDDGSGDNTMEIVKRWQKNHPDGNGFTSVLKTFPNGKLCMARNRGLAMAHGKYIQYVDDDDWLYPDAIERKIAYAADHPEIDLIVNQLDYYRDGKIVAHTGISLPGHGENLIAWLLDHECLISPVLMFKTAALQQLGGWKEGLIFAEDMELVVRFAVHEGKIGIVDRSLSGYRLHTLERQTLNVRDRLPDFFCAELYGGLFRLCVREKQDNVPVRAAFLRHYDFDANHFIRAGKFESARQCILAKKEINGDLSFRDLLRLSFAGHFCWRLSHFYHRIRARIKRIIKEFSQ